MQCLRCNGLMVLERFNDLWDNTGEIHFEGLRCLVCGEIVDPMILTNRTKTVPLLVH